MKKAYGILLSLSEKDNEILRPIIKKLQKEYVGKEPFEPHVTLYSMEKKMELREVKNLVDEISKTTRPFSIKMRNLGHKEKWSKILYIRLRVNKNIIKIHNFFEEKIEKTKKNYMPHISLIYTDRLTNKERKEIKKQLTIPNEFTVSGIQILSTSDETDSWKDYLKWKIEYQKSFK